MNVNGKSVSPKNESRSKANESKLAKGRRGSKTPSKAKSRRVGKQDVYRTYTI